MNRRFHNLILLLAIAVGWRALPSIVYAQPKFRIPITVTDSLTVPKSITAYFGVHPLATNCIDTLNREPIIFTGFSDHWDLNFFDKVDDQTAGEQEFPPPFALDIRFVNISPSRCLGGGVFVNLHNYASRTQIDTFRVAVNHQDGPSATTPLIYTWPSVLGEYCDSMFLTATIQIDDQGTTQAIKIDMTKVSKYTAYYNNLSSSQLGQSPPFRITMYGPKIPPPPPDSVLLSTPADGATSQSVDPIVSWNAGPQAKYYRYQFSTDPTFATVLFEDTTSATSKQFHGLQELKTYYWRVVIYNPYGVSFWHSHPFRFTTLLLPPPAPTLISPTSGQQNQPTTATLKWRNVPLAPATYQIRVASDTGFTSLVKDTSGVSDTTVQVGGLQNCLTYYWKVKATNASGAGPFTATNNFRIIVAPPGVPVLSQPLDNATGVAPSALLSWSGDVCSDLFRVQVARDTGFTNFFSISVATQASAIIGPLGQDSVYFWRVNAVNAVDSSLYTAYRSFRTRLDPPSLPVLVFPANNDSTRAAVDTLRWRKTIYTDRYHVQISRDQTFTTVLVNDSTITDTTTLTVPLEGCSKYFWRVRSRNASGYGNFSIARSFKIRTLVPGKPTLVGPANDSTNVDERTTISWRGDACTQNYFYHVSRLITFGDTVASGSTAQTSAAIGPLQGNTDFYWRVRGSNSIGTGTFADSFHFKTTALVTPAIPVLRTPANGVGNFVLPSSLVWDSAGRAITYRVQVAIDSNYSILIVNDSTVSQQVGVQPSKPLTSPPMQNSTTYFWHVNAKNAAGTSAFSSTSRFTTLFPPLSTILIEPADRAQDVSVAPEFIWSVADRAVSFHLQVAKDSLFSNTVFSDTTIVITSWQLVSRLEGLTKHYWRVRAKNSAGWGQWSNVHSFTTTRTGVANWLIPVTVAETGPARDVVYLGVNPAATAGIDAALGEFELPPVLFGFFDIRFVSPLIGEGLRVDVVRFRTYSQVDTFQIQFQPGIGSYPMTFSWPRTFIRAACDSMVIFDQATSLRARMDIDSILTVPNSSVRTLTIIKYGAFPMPLDVKPIAPEIPQGFVLYQNYPNPFNPTTHVQFSTDRSAQIRLTIYDVLGREIATVANTTFFPGQYSLEWNGKDEQGNSVPSGVYYVRMIASPLSEAGADNARYTSTRKMLMLK